MTGNEDPRRAIRALADEIGRAADQAVRMMRQAVDDVRVNWAPPTVRPSQGGPAGSPAEMIRELARLRDDGLITEEEFQAKKSQLLERI